MFPTAVTAAILGRRRIPLKTHKLFIAVTIMLFATIVVKNARISGDYSSVDNINPLNAIAEMGSSLRAIEEVITWRNTGFELLYGESYWAPFERQLALFLPIERLPSLQDKRLLNVVVMERAGPIGFSPVAEAYANFGEKGIILISIFLGGLFAKLDRVASTLRSDILIGVAIIPLFVMIRNSFAFIPVQIFIGLVLAFIILQLAKVKMES
jgi:oligosaccharide repeat unit polymerase